MRSNHRTTGYLKHYWDHLYALSLTGTPLDSLTRGLVPVHTAGGRPREVDDRDDEEAVAVIGQTCEGVVPGGESAQKTEEAAGLDDGRVGFVVGVALDVSDTEQKEGYVEGEKDGEEGHGGLEGTEEQDGRKDEPALERG